MYPVTIKANRKLSKAEQKKIKGFGLTWDGVEYSGIVSNGTSKRIERYCEKKNLHFKIKNALGTRGSDYRRIFFIYHKPSFGDRYICAYCGRWLEKKEVAVDHLYPISKVSKSIKLQKKLIRRGIKNINAPENLVAACERCNKRKGTKMGSWVLRGILGQNKWLWLIRYVLRVLIIAAGIVVGFLLVSGKLTL